MFSIQELFAKDDKFLELLQQSAQAGRDSVRALKEVMESREVAQRLEAFAAARRQDKVLTTRIAELLARASITSLDREDVEAISKALYKIPKTVEKFAERYTICSAQLTAIDFSAQLALAEQCTDTVAGMIKALEKSHFTQVNTFNERLQMIEGDGDKLMLKLLADLYNGGHPPQTVIIVKDLYELLEKVMDRCRDVGDVVANVVLKHS
ncbi:MAG: DUF47 domain-containing protein [Limisphaerales bacterium]